MDADGAASLGAGVVSAGGACVVAGGTEGAGSLGCVGGADVVAEGAADDAITEDEELATLRL